MSPIADRDPGRYKVVSEKHIQALVNRRQFIGGSAAGLAALGLTGKSFASTSRQQAYVAAAAQEQFEIIIATLGEAPNINPFIAADSEENWRCAMLFDELVRIDPITFEPVPGIAREWSIEGNLYTFTLNDAMYSDGTPVTASDVKFAIEGHLTPATGSPRQSKYNNIVGASEVIDGSATECAGVVAVDDKTVTIETKQADAALLYNLRFIRPVPSDVVRGMDLANDEWFQAPIGAGPFKFESWDVGADFVMTRNENFFEEGKPALSKVTHRVIPQSDTIVLALVNNEVDGSNYPTATAGDQLDQNQDLVVMVPPFNSPNGWMFNCAHPLLSNRDVRRAIAMGLDREQFAADALMGLGKAGIGPIAPGSWAYDANLEAIPFDQDQARKLIKDAGAEGSEIRFVVNAGNVLREDWLIYSEQMLKEIGIVVKPETVEWATLVDAVTVTHDFEVAGGDWTGVTNEPTELWDQFHTDGSINRMSYSNSELDALLDEVRVTTDVEMAKPIFAQIQEILVQDVPFLHAWYRPFLHTVNSRFADYTDSSESLFYTLKDWTAAS